MAKIADRYFKEDPWRIVEEGFNPDYSRVGESVFALANEYMGVRGYFEEGYSGESLKGSYFSGIYERKEQEKSGYVGIANTTEFMVSSVDWLSTKITADGKRLDLNVSTFRDFTRSLNMKTGLLTRSFVWEVAPGEELRVTMERVLSMAQPECAAHRITFEPISFSGRIQTAMGLDCSVLHESVGENLWECTDIQQQDQGMELSAHTVHTGQEICSAMQVAVSAFDSADFCQAGTKGEEVSAKLCQNGAKEQDVSCGFVRTGWEQRGKSAALVYESEVVPGKIYRIERRVCNLLCRSAEEQETFNVKRKTLGARTAQLSFDGILAGNQTWWKQVWDSCDIEIRGDKENQQGIRFCIFQLFQTYHGAIEGNNIGAKGLTGEAYNGNAFWDTETYCLPFFLFNDLEGARSLLYFRYRTLEQAKERAAQLDCKGAFYPIATISGRECCNLWQHASLQLQASTAVAYGIWCYEKVSGDEAFLEEAGLEMLIEISRMLASRGNYSADGSRYGYYCVMGPDEFQMMVNHDCYTNYMGRFTFRYTLDTLERFRRERPQALETIADKTGLTLQEQESWDQMAQRMYIPYDEERKLYEQQEGFFELPHIDVDQIPVEEFPLYSHWSYDRIYRNDMIKQPAVLMMMLLFNSSFDEEELKNNYEYYEPRCIHESSLSPSVHSILACQLKKWEEAYEFFRFATRMDLDNYNRNSGEGIHTTSIAAAWMNIVYGFGGFRSDGEMLSLNPSIPDQWEGYSFHLHYRGSVLHVQVDKEQVVITAESDAQSNGNQGSGFGGKENTYEAIRLKLYGEIVMIGSGRICRPIPKEWRG